MLDAGSSGSRPFRHDAETFRVAEELIMLSSRPPSAPALDGGPNDSPSNISGFFEQMKTRSSRRAAHKSNDRDGANQEFAEVAPAQSADIINSRCDLSHSELLKEHRVHFRRVRRRWNNEQRTKKQEYLARFHVQGIPLVQHLEALTHWSKGNSASGALLEARRIPGSSDGNTRPATAQVQDTTALEIAASDALFGQTGADESWAWGDAAAATSAPTATDFLARGNHNPRKTGGIRNATGGADSMGNYDRHHRGAQVAGMSHQLPRMKTSGNASNGAPYLHQFLERNSANNSTNPQLFNATNSFGDASMSTNMTGKRPRPGNSSSFLTPSFGFPSPPPLETDHPLPDFNNWGFGGRNVTRMSSGATISSSSAMPAASHGNSISTANLSAIGSGLSSPNGASMFAAQNQHQQVQPPLYMTSDDELKMDYPQLTEFNQDLDSYLNDTMESGGPSPTTPLGTSAKTGKRPRSRQCEFPGCQNRARSHQKCKKHGGAHQCVFEGCTKNSQSRGLCIAHGGGSRCKREGCVRAAQSKGLCKSHGGGEFCAVEGCNKKAHLKHLCRTHGGGVRCKVDKCLKWAQRKGWCMAHAKEFAAT
uniref:WRKY19-like zinc finger domain-containing protein n=1 Tax=Phytophthora ramorum TaxID=164328 RepID=H3HD33_PHYRM